MLASEALAITNNNIYKMEAVQCGIENLEKRIKRAALNGLRNCIVDFDSYPCNIADFLAKHGEENREAFKHYNIECELREHFTKNGFKFKYVTDAVSGGVRQDPYWIICW